MREIYTDKNMILSSS